MNTKGKNYEIAFDPEAKTGLISILDSSLRGIDKRISDLDPTLEGRIRVKIRSSGTRHEWEMAPPLPGEEESILHLIEGEMPTKLYLSANLTTRLIYHGVEFSEMKDSTEIVEGKEIPCIEAKWDAIPCPVVITTRLEEGGEFEEA